MNYMRIAKSIRRRQHYKWRAYKTWNLCNWHLWYCRSLAAKRGFTPDEIRGKSASNLMSMMYDEL